MLSRALLVLLLVINLGVAAWWISRPSGVAASEPIVLPAGVPGLELLRESAPAPQPVLRQCVRFGPYTDAPSQARARAGLQAYAVDGRVVELSQAAPPATAWRVLMPPGPDAAAARALAARIASAGFDDYLVVNEGAEANSIALGLFRSLAAARRRQEELAATGFDAQIHANGGETVFLALAIEQGRDPVQVRLLVGALQVQAMDCADLSEGPQ